MKNPPVILVDIDGTLADNNHRQHFLEDEDWAAFFNAMEDDLPIMPMIALTTELWTGGYRVILVTGRPETHRAHTERWLEHHQVIHDDLLMREEGDLRPDTEVKREIVERLGPVLDHVEFALEDHSRLAAMYRSMGIMCLLVGEDRY